MKTVLLLFGGESSEHEVSIASATNVSQVIDLEKFSIRYGFIDKQGEWWLVDGVSAEKPDTAQRLLPILGLNSFAIEGTDQSVTPDVILPVLHGRNGEDGSVQALAQLLHIPIVGCDMTSSAAAMNKYITKELASANGINVAPYGVHYAGDPAFSYKGVSDNLGATLFVKPANAGSSVGVHKVTSQEELDGALDDAHTHDSIVLVEQAINARELEVAVLGNYPSIQASLVGEVKPDGAFYTYESKYDSTSTSEVVIPAEISAEISDEIRSQAVKLFHLLGGSGLARVDFFLDNDTQKIYLNEINTLPGFTDISMYPKLWEKSGITYAHLVDQLIELALEKK